MASTLTRAAPRISFCDMFPIRDHNPSTRIPYVTFVLMAANIGVFLSYVGLLGDERAHLVVEFEYPGVRDRCRFDRPAEEHLA